MQFKKVLLALTLLVSSFSMMAYEFTINSNIVFPDGTPAAGATIDILISGTLDNYVVVDNDGNATITYDIDAGTTQTFTLETLDWCTGEILSTSVDSFEGAVDVDFVLCASLFEGCQAYFSYQTDLFSTDVAFANNSTVENITSFFWDFGDGNTSTEENPTHTYTASGSYDVTFTIASDTCDASTTSYVYVGEPSGISCFSSFYYTYNDLNDPLTASFIDVSDAAGVINSWSWDFGDGNTSTEQNPVHTYAEDGIYLATLTIGTEDDCEATISYEVYVGDIIWGGGDCASIYSYTVDPDDNFTFNFIDESIGDVVEWFWEFGDGNTSTEQNPTHTYAEAGTYIPALTITTEDGCTNYYCIFVFPGDGNTGSGCDAWFFAENIGQYDYQFFSGDIFGTPFESVSWDFGDGNTSTEPTPIHTYADAGVYDVVLTAINNGDTCTATLPLDVYYNDIPECEAYFSLFANDWQNPYEISFIDYSYALSPIVGWAWDFGDGNTSTEQNPIHTYTEDGTYTITLTITSETGCTASFETLWTVELPCDCPLVYDPVCVDLGQGFIVEYYNECFAACDGLEVVECDNLPSDCEASYFLNIDPATFTVEFVDFSYATTDIVSWAWDFGDGNTSEEQNPIHTYDSNNEYEVTLTILTADGCTSSFTTSFNLNGGSVGGDETMAFFWLEQNQDDLMEFTFIDQSMGNVDSWTWDFGDGNSSTEQNPTHTYAEAGIYLVTLYVANSVDGSSSVFTNLISTDTDIWYNNECQSLFIPFIQDDLNVGFLDLTWGPNPLQNELNINIDYTTNADATITMTNQLGQNVITQKAKLLAGANQMNLTTAALSTGVYYLTIQTETHRETKMVVKY